MELKDYFKEQRFNIDRLYFDYEGKRYHGQGILDWVPNDGFKLEACINNNDVKNLSKSKLEFGKIGIKKTCCIYMKHQGGKWAIAPNTMPYHEFLNVLSSVEISVNFDRIIFSDSQLSNNQSDHFRGTALYQTKTKVNLSDFISNDIKIDGNFSEGSWSTSSGISHDNTKQKISGHIFDEKFIQLNSEHTKEFWTKKQAWKWLEATEYTFSMLFGETIKLLYRNIDRGSRKYIEVRTQQPLYLLGVLSLFDSPGQLNKEHFIKLTEFLTLNLDKGSICQNIFLQMIESSQQKSLQAKELLLSTIILEAALRTLEKRPYQENDKWNIEGALKRFRDTYFSREWKKLCKPDEKIIQTYRDLRHRNAHPDWLFTERGYLSKEQMEKSLDDRIFLSRFYGYMILAIAGFKDLKPDFPLPHKEWEPESIMNYKDFPPEEKAIFEEIKERGKNNNII